MLFKKLVIIFYIVLLVVMAGATILENIYDTDYVGHHIYGAWWFSLLWAILAASGIAWIIKRRMKKWYLVMLHASFVIILLGAFLTHTTSFKSTIHLRVNQIVSPEDLSFQVKLRSFTIHHYQGTSTAADYSSEITFIDGENKEDATVSMNNIATYQGVRFYQSTFDEDGQGSTLSINSDPYGIPVTYTGYALLFFSLIWLLIAPDGSFRRNLQLLKKAALLILILSPLSTHAANTFSEQEADRFGRIMIDYHGRIAPLQSYAYDFTKKLYGKRSYDGKMPEQVVAGFIFWSKEWMNEKIIKVKSGELKSTLQLPDYISVNDMFIMGDYRLKNYIEEYYNGNHDKFHEQAAKIDEKIQLVMELRYGTSLNPIGLSKSQIEHFFNTIYEYTQNKNTASSIQLLDNTLQLQKQKAGKSIPSDIRIKAERLYNQIPFATILFMANLTLGFIALFFTIREMTSKKIYKYHYILTGLLLVSFLSLSLALGLRWTASGNIPLSNGYESMLSVAWFTMLFTIISSFMIPRLSSLANTFGFLLSGFFLLVSHISQMDPAIGQIMPVLNSPLLSIHVSIIMMSYALLALTFICGLLGLFMRSQASMLQTLSRVFLYPAITTMGIGIFVGAIWANVSWGTYWSWDPKETWALITFMIYGAILHTQTLPVFQKPRTYHLYMIFAFLSIIMTYFGVNYILGGMHSYA